jgi:3-methyladenine DNA glycosylase AlkD
MVSLMVKTTKMTLPDILQQLEQMGNENTKKVLIRHGAREPFFGVKIEDLKKIVKKVKTNYSLSKELFNTGNSDAMYLAGLIADPAKMTRDDLIDWVQKAYWYMLSEFTVAWVASESPYGQELALQWIDSKEENIASTGWSTLACIASLKNDDEIDRELYTRLLQRVAKTIHSEQNRVRHTMNSFVITIGGYCSHLSAEALQVASSLGKVNVSMGGTACKVPDATEYIHKMHDRGLLGKKRKTARC